VAFIAAGVPGIVLAGVLWRAVGEPPRGAGDGLAGERPREAAAATLAFLASQTSFVIVLIGFCLSSITNYATSV
jgi:hypothetical protein